MANAVSEDWCRSQTQWSLSIKELLKDLDLTGLTAEYAVFNMNDVSTLSKESLA